MSDNSTALLEIAKGLRRASELLMQMFPLLTPEEAHPNHRAVAAEIADAVDKLEAFVSLVERRAPKCAHGHTSRQVGCVSCVLVFDRPAEHYAKVGRRTSQPADHSPEKTK